MESVASDLTGPWPAPAKLNRFLRIVGRRADGYHLLQTIFQFLDSCDYLSFMPRGDGLIQRQNEIPGVAADNDLSIRAARLLQQVSGIDAGVTIAIDKRLPLGGGLGGGSSDAATTLVALNHYWDIGLSENELAKLGVSLGADVPVFIHGQAAWAEGIGDQLTPINPDEPWFVVLKPCCTIATSIIFNEPTSTRDSQPIKMRDFVGEDTGNDCEPVVFERYPAVAAAASWLSHYARAHLTGTGSCVFAAFSDKQTAQRALARLPTGLSGFLARGRNRSLLQERLQRAKIAPPDVADMHWAVAKR